MFLSVIRISSLPVNPSENLQQDSRHVQLESSNYHPTLPKHDQHTQRNQRDSDRASERFIRERFGIKRLEMSTIPDSRVPSSAGDKRTLYTSAQTHQGNGHICGRSCDQCRRTLSRMFTV